MRTRTETAQEMIQPTITKHIQSQRSGIQPYYISRAAIGYVVKGKKYIYYGDNRYLVNKGDIFYLKAGNHYIEDVPGEDKCFEQITFFYSPDALRDILTTLNNTYNMEIVNDHSCVNCKTHSHAVYSAWSTASNFFNTVNLYLKENIFNQPTAEKLKTTELIYLIFTQTDCCIKNMIFKDINDASENFVQIIMQNIFSSKSIEELAQVTNRSVTSFKKEFKKLFEMPPHKWFIKKRLTHSCLLLVSTNKPIAQIGTECCFPNTSHYIKLFKKEYGQTPTNYRRKQRNKLHENGEETPVSHLE